MSFTLHANYINDKQRNLRHWWKQVVCGPCSTGSDKA